jgi:hypothetical protein
MDTNIVVALIGAGATIVAAVITGLYQRQQPFQTMPDRSDPKPAMSADLRDTPEQNAKQAERNGQPKADPQAHRSQSQAAESEEPEYEDEPPSLEQAPPNDGATATAAESVLVPCPSCGRAFTVIPRLWFKKVRCRACKAVFRTNPITGAELLKPPVR